MRCSPSEELRRSVSGARPTGAAKEVETRSHRTRRRLPNRTTTLKAGVVHSHLQQSKSGPAALARQRRNHNQLLMAQGSTCALPKLRPRGSHPARVNGRLPFSGMPSLGAKGLSMEPGARLLSAHAQRTVFIHRPGTNARFRTLRPSKGGYSWPECPKMNISARKRALSARGLRRSDPALRTNTADSTAAPRPAQSATTSNMIVDRSLEVPKLIRNSPGLLAIEYSDRARRTALIRHLRFDA